MVVFCGPGFLRTWDYNGSFPDGWYCCSHVDLGKNWVKRWMKALVNSPDKEELSADLHTEMGIKSIEFLLLSLILDLVGLEF